MHVGANLREPDIGSADADRSEKWLIFKSQNCKLENQRSYSTPCAQETNFWVAENRQRGATLRRRGLREAAQPKALREGSERSKSLWRKFDAQF